MSDKELRRIFRFDETDLIANRNGELSPRQIERLKKKVRADRKSSLTIGLALAGISVLPFAILWFSGAPWLVYLIWGVIWVPVWGSMSISILSISVTAPELPGVRVAEGPLELAAQGARKRAGSAFVMKVGDKTFESDFELSDAVKAGDDYSVYYADGTDEVLSVERSSRKK